VDALAEVMHAHSGQAFFDYAAAAPYLTVDMHPPRPECRKDAVFVSVHKFLGGPQTPGLLAARNDLFAEPVPAEPGGGTVLYTSPWEWRYLGDPEEREQGGTPPIVQVVRAALAFELKRMLGADRILAAEEELSRRLLHRWRRHPRIDLLGMDEADDTRELLAGVPGGTGEAGAASPRRLGIFSLIFDGGRLHHHLAVRLLSDRFGIQVRGGCMCAGTYGHDLLGISQEQSEGIRQQLDLGLGCRKPGWVRVSLSPVSTAAEVDFLADAVDELLERWGEWQRDYVQDEHSGEWRHRSFTPPVPALRLDPEAPGAPFTSPS
jgi:selenocysteine lyase/cysteine desulfurase